MKVHDFFLLLGESKKKKKQIIYNFASLPVGASASPLGFTLERASVAGYENGDNAFIVDGAAINQARIAQIGSHRGLRMEGPTTNMITSNPRAAHLWAYGPASGTSALAAGELGPDSQAGYVTLHNINLGGYSKYFGGLTLAAVRYTASAWLKKNTLDAFQINPFSTGNHGFGGTLAAEWLRYSNEYIAAATISGGFIPADGRSSGVAAGARNYYSDLHQLEKGPLSSYTNSSRAGERGYLPGAPHVSNGKLRPIIEWYPTISAAGAQTWAIGNRRIWRLDEGNYAEIIIGGTWHSYVKVCIGGTSELLSTPLPDWSVGDSLNFYVSAGNGVPTGWYEHNGGARTSLGTGTTDMDPLLVEDSNIDFFCSETTSQMIGLIEKITFLL